MNRTVMKSLQFRQTRGHDPFEGVSNVRVNCRDFFFGLGSYALDEGGGTVADELEEPTVGSDVWIGWGGLGKINRGWDQTTENKTIKWIFWSGELILSCGVFHWADEWLVGTVTLLANALCTSK